MRGTCFGVKLCAGLLARPRCGGAVAEFRSVSWTLCPLQGVVEALRALCSQTPHAVLSASLSAIALLSSTGYLPLILGEELRRVSKLGAGLTHGSRLMA